MQHSYAVASNKMDLENSGKRRLKVIFFCNVYTIYVMKKNKKK